ncbi:MAG: sensor histidine kinase, partial [Owenweeksia sp.]
IPLGLIINELITNAFKYGLQNQARPKLRIFMRCEDDTLLLSITDNGPGISEENEEVKTKGLKLVRLFAQQLNGSVDLENDNGLKATVKVKIKPAA